jgi:uncharacterized protein YcbK (DUF882 family)
VRRIPQTINGTDCYELVERWLISPQLAVRLMLMADNFHRRTSVGLKIISGFRTAAEQAELRSAGRPAAEDQRSTHRSCPATGADLTPEMAATHTVRILFGEAAFLSGLRWGGGSGLDANGVPSDWNHVDLGPRRS